MARRVRSELALAQAILAPRSLRTRVPVRERDLLQRSHLHHPMKRICLLAGFFFTTLVQANPADAPNAASAQALMQALKDVQAQQATITENQAKIDELIAGVAEAARVARIYSSRSRK